MSSRRDDFVAGVDAAPRKMKSNGTEPAYRFKLVPFEAIELNRAPAYLVKGLLPREGLAVIWGPPKCGKTFWALDVTMHIAIGRTYRGRKVQRGTVIYVAYEGERGLGARVTAWRAERLGDHSGRVPFRLLSTRLKLPADARQLIEEIRAQVAEPIAVIVIDTLNRSIDGSESSDEDMTAYVGAADRIREVFDCLVAVIHHCGHEASRPRGHTSLTGAADCQIAVKRDAAGLVVAKLEWMKDGPEGTEILSRLNVVELGLDDEGDPITSCVIEPADGEAAKNGKTIGGQAGIALRELRNAIADEGQQVPKSRAVSGTFQGVPVPLWRRYCYAAFLGDRDNERDNEDTKRKAFGRASKTLQEREFIGVWNDWVWVVE